MNSKLLLTATALAIGFATASAPASAADYSKRHYHGSNTVKHSVGVSRKIDARQANQARRIRQGVRTGKLTRLEAVRLKTQQAYIRQLERSAKRDGVITKRERARILSAQRSANRAIYAQKHDRQTRGKWFKKWF
ncbi:MAG: hypothetical protein KDJ45_12990 [Hyphomicrobiaceae bacterium]|nr:hypothetical protein [Hyphomicrobiaceae bacterium]MCC0010570.1 hypothetical protein [Hyphomicrobiaceae bacterium]